MTKKQRKKLVETVTHAMFEAASADDRYLWDTLYSWLETWSDKDLVEEFYFFYEGEETKRILGFEFLHLVCAKG